MDRLPEEFLAWITREPEFPFQPRITRGDVHQLLNIWRVSWRSHHWLKEHKARPAAKRAIKVYSDIAKIFGVEAGGFERVQELAFKYLLSGWVDEIRKPAIDEFKTLQKSPFVSAAVVAAAEALWKHIRSDGCECGDGRLDRILKRRRDAQDSGNSKAFVAAEFWELVADIVTHLPIALGLPDRSDPIEGRIYERPLKADDVRKRYSGAGRVLPVHVPV